MILRRLIKLFFFLKQHRLAHVMLRTNMASQRFDVNMYIDLRGTSFCMKFEIYVFVRHFCLIINVIAITNLLVYKFLEIKYCAWNGWKSELLGST